MEPMVYVAAAVLVGILLILVTFLRKSVTGGQDVAEPQVAAVRRRAVPRGPEAPPGARRRAPRNRMAAGQQLQDSDEEDEEDPFSDVALPEGKVGAKKLAKLQAKAEKRSQRQAEIQEREEQKRRQALLEEDRKKEEARDAAVEAARAEEEKRRKEEEEARQHEEYLLLKKAFTVEEEGTHEEELNQDTDSLLQQFIDYIQDMKVVMLEDLAAHFKLKTQEAIDRVKDLQAEGRLQGLMDDRGKFISITQSELEAVAKFIRQRGRVSISELAECSNKLINLNHDKETLHRLIGSAEVKAS